MAVVLPGSERPAVGALRGRRSRRPPEQLYAELLPLGRLDMTPKLVQYFKAALEELGIGGGPCRPPRMPLTVEELETLRAAVAAADPTAVGGR